MGEETSPVTTGSTPRVFEEEVVGVVAGNGVGVVEVVEVSV